MPRGNADVTRSKLLDATDALLTERPGRTPTVAELCARADVNVAMVKYCFGSKSGLLDALLERSLEGLAAEVEGLARSGLPPEEQLRRHVSEIVRNYVRYPYVNRLMTQRLMLAEPDGVDRISRSFAIPVRAFYDELLAAGRTQRRLAADRLDAVLLLRRRRLRVPVLGAPAARARVRRADRRRARRALQRARRRAGPQRGARLTARRQSGKPTAEPSSMRSMYSIIP